MTADNYVTRFAAAASGGVMKEGELVASAGLCVGW